MVQYTFREGDEILQQLIKNKEKNYALTAHLKHRAKIRNIDLNYIQEMLTTKEPLGVLSSRKNRFKLFYPSQHHSEIYDLIIVIAIDNDKKVIGVTTYEDYKTYREGVI